MKGQRPPSQFPEPNMNWPVGAERDRVVAELVEKYTAAGIPADAAHNAAMLVTARQQ